MENIAYILTFLSVFIYAIFYFNKSFEIDLKYFVAYLFLMFSFELIAAYIYANDGDTMVVYNILTLLEFNCLFIFLKTILESKSTKKNITMLIWLFNIVYLFSSIYYFNSEGVYLEKYNTIASIFGGITITIGLFFFLKDFLNSDKILNYRKTLSFWIAFGMLVYYLGTIPTTTIINNMKETSELFVYLYKLQYTLLIFMHSCFIFGALWSQKKVR